jgi:uncharacterized RDD family membrane protein YckC
MTLSTAGAFPADPATDAWLTRGVLARRFEAWLLDGFFLLVLSAAAWVFCLAFGMLTLGLGWPLFHLLPALPFVYSVGFLLSPLSATPGQWLRGLAVRRDDDFGPPELWQAVVCTIGYYVTLATSGLLLLIALFTERRRTLHDMAAGVVVVRRKALAEVPQADVPQAEVPLTSFGVASNMSSRSWPQ